MWDKEDRQILMVNSTVGVQHAEKRTKTDGVDFLLTERAFHDTMTAQSKG